MSTQGRIPVANAPCSWGALEFEGLGGEQIAYTQMLDELSATGYVGTELGDWDYMPTEPALLQHELTSRGLSLRGAFVPVALFAEENHAEGVERAARTAKLLAAAGTPGDPPLLVLADANGSIPQRVKYAGRIEPHMGLTSREWTVFAEGTMRIAAAVRSQTGLRTVFHHHCAGYIETPEEIRKLLDLTDPELLGLVFDTGHYVYGSGSNHEAVLQGLEEFGDRIWYIHFKDCEPAITSRARQEKWGYFEAVSHGVFCELGQGCVDFEGVLAWLQAKGYDGWIVVEQDVLPGMGSPKESAARNRRYLCSLGL